MATDNRIKFSLTSDYNGAGFQQALKDIDNTAKSSARASDGVQKLANAATQMPGPVGQAASSASGFLGTLKSLFQATSALPGPLKIAALAIGSFTTGWSIGMSIVGDKVEEARQRVERAANALQAGIKSRLNWLRNKMDEDLAAMRDNIKSTIAAFDKLIGRVNKVKAAKDAGNAAQATNAGLLLQTQRDAELAGIQDENERAILAARWEEKIALEERVAVIKQNTENEKEADHNLKNAQDRRAMIEGLVAEAKAAVAEAERDAAAAEKTGTKDMKPFADRIQKARENLAMVEEELWEQETNVKVAEENRKTTLVQNENALLENESNVIKLNEATQRLIDAQTKAAKEQEINAEKTKLNNQISSIKAATDKKITDIDKDIADHRKNIKDIEKAREGTKKGVETDHKKSTFRGGYQYQTDKDGVIAPFEDWQRAKRYA